MPTNRRRKSSIILVSFLPCRSEANTNERIFAHPKRKGLHPQQARCFVLRMMMMMMMSNINKAPSFHAALAAFDPANAPWPKKEQQFCVNAAPDQNPCFFSYEDVWRAFHSVFVRADKRRQ